MSGALFGSVSGGGRSGSKNLVEFRAGKMYLKGTTVTPDKRKGQVYIHQSDDSLIHFCWKDRTSGVVEDDLIIFPDDCEFKRVPQCTTGRAYILKFKSSSRKFFFWIQEPKTDKDEENCKKVNDSLNNPPAPGSGRGGAGGLPPELASLGAGLGEGGLQSMLGNIDHQQLMQLLGSGGLPALTSMGAGLPGLGSSRPASSQSTAASTPQAQTTAPATLSSSTTSTNAIAATTTATTAVSVTTPTTPPIQLSDLQSILRSMNIPSGNQPQQERVDLTQMLTSDVMTPILSNPEIQQQLLQFAPEGEALPRDPERLRETLQSPQFQQAMGMFTAAFQSGQLGPLMDQFGLSQEATEAANQGDLEAFGQALQGGSAEGSSDKKTEEKKDQEGGNKDEKKDDDDSMQVD